MRTLEIISTCALVIAAAGLWINWLQLHENGKQRRAEWLARLHGRFLEDPELAEMFQLLEYKKFVYDDRFHDSPNERKLDRLLQHYETIAMIYDRGRIEEVELRLFRFQFHIVYSNQQVKNYFAYLDEWFHARKMPEEAFVRSRRLAKLIQDKLGDSAS